MTSLMLYGIGSAPPPMVCATWDSGAKGTAVTLSGGGLIETTSHSATGSVRATVGILTGTQHYWESTITGNNISNFVGFSNSSSNLNQYPGQNTNSWGYQVNSGQIVHNGIAIQSLATGIINDIISIALDTTGNTAQFYKNGIALGTPLTIPG